MRNEDNSGASAKAGAFFEKAQKAAETHDFDGAIQVYLEGLRYAADAVEQGHIKLRELALLRQEQGGQKPSMAEATERLQGATPLERMLNAEYLLAKDPEHLPYAEAVLQAALEGGYKATAKWIADLMFLANNNAKKPSLQRYIMLKDSYIAIGRFSRALAACQWAAKLNPKDKDLAEECKMLSAKVSAARRRRGRRGGLARSIEGHQGYGELQGQQDIGVTADYDLLAGGQAGGDNGLESIAESDIGQDLAKARAFFDKARKIAETKNFDYAIDMYLEGLRFAPDALQEGHLPLCELALQRRGKGGKKPSMMERMKRSRGKTPLEQMLNAEYLYVKDPDHLPYAEAMLKAAVTGGYNRTAGWVANLIFQTNNAAKKPSVQTYILLKDCYAALGDFDKAVAACQRACKLKPSDADLADDFKNLTAELTMARGKYDQDGDFRKSIKDREAQEKLHAQQSVVKTEDYRVLAVKEAREKLAKNPDLSMNIFNLAETLSDLQNDESENEAVELLESTYRTKNDFSFKQRAGLVRIKQLRRKLRQAKVVAEAKPGDAQAKGRVEELSKQLNDTELDHYRLCTENYPTDLQPKYEYGVRLIRNKRYDEAIPLFQEAQRDPRRKISAMDKIGLCFFMKGWFADAIDVFNRAIDSYEIQDDKIAKELRYNLARSYEEHGETEKALEVYRKIAQLDFAYKDVSERVDKLRRSQNKD
jgi:protein involved in temperature-dependent protein secretion